MVVLTDIEDRKRAEEALRSSEGYLQNIIERSVIVCETPNFSVVESWLSQQPCDRRAEGKFQLSDKVAAQEREIIEASLRETQGRVFGPSGAAAKLGVARSTLGSKIRSLKMNKNRFKAQLGILELSSALRAKSQ